MANCHDELSVRRTFHTASVSYGSRQLAVEESGIMDCTFTAIPLVSAVPKNFGSEFYSKVAKG